MDSKSQRSQSQDYKNNQRKRSTRKKKPVQNKIVQKSSRRTRRKDKQSQQQYALPENIPITDSTDLNVFQSFDRETSKIIIQLPLPLLKLEKEQRKTQVRVEEKIIDLKIIIQEHETIIIEAKINIDLRQQKKEEDQEQQTVFTVWGKSYWVGNYEINSKLFKQAYKTLSNSYYQIIKFKAKEINSDIFVVLNFREKINTVEDYNGLINQGNTCYMNSYLQMLFHISQFKNLVFQAHVTDENKFPATLQILFYKLAHQEKPVSAEQLVKSFGWSKKEAQIQQDAQEFSCLFFQVLEQKLLESCFDSKRHNMTELFSGKLLHIIECIDVGKRSLKQQPFFDLQIGLSDSLEHSLDDYVSEQLLLADNMYHTDYYGKQSAKKSVRIQQLPPILMIQLKRFQFSTQTYKNQKILRKFRYPNQIDFTKWLVKGQGDNTYCLYSVLVHEGVKAQSGHYYVYIKVEDTWYKFNDQDVNIASERQVFDYNFGGENDVIDIDSRELKVTNRKVTCGSTAYMLVYVRKQLIQTLINNEIVYPEWLKERQITKLSEKQQLKARKNYYHHIKALSWNDNLLHKNANFIGLIQKNYEDTVFEELQKIPKAQKIQQWLIPYNKQGLGVYLYLTNFQRTEYQSLINLQHRTSTFQEVIRDQTNLIFIFLPLIIDLNSYLYAVKLMTLDSQSSQNEEDMQKKEENYETKIQFSDIVQINKFMKNYELIDKLTNIYGQEGYTTSFYYEEKKELKPIFKDSNLVCGPVGVRNILQIIIAVKIPIPKINKKIDYAQNWYSQHKNTVQLIVKSEDSRYLFAIYADQNMTIEQLRQLIFQQKLKDDNLYASPSNIVLKAKLKKTSKTFTQLLAAKTVKDLIKGYDREKIIIFEPSSLKADERLSQTQIKFSYRLKDFSFSDPCSIIIDKQVNDQSDSIHKKINDHPQIQKFLENEKLSGIRLLLFSKDKMTINQIVLQNGFIPGKGQIVSVLQKQKNTNLVVQGSQKQNISEQLCPIIVNHKSRNGQKVGKPRYLQFDRNITLIHLREEIVQSIKNQTYQWDEKIYSINPFKLYIYAYVKDIRKKVDLIQQRQLLQQQISQIRKDLKNQQNSPLEEQKSQNGSQNIKKNGQNTINEVIDVKSDNENQKQHIKTETEKLPGELANKNASKPQNSQYLTINQAFPGCKYLKVCINHLYLVRINQMKLNV